MNDSTTSNTTTERYDAFTVRKYQAGGQERTDWLRIGTAFPHKDGKGFSVNLQAVPVDGHVELRLHEPKAKEA